MLVSAIMPTANRRHLLPVAIASFLSQDWPEKELVVVDDGDESIADLLGAVRNTYVRLHHPQSLGWKMNLACRLAHGNILIAWDDDDWSASDRMRNQARLLLVSRRGLTGYGEMLFWDMERGEAYNVTEPVHVYGTSLCFTREYWSSHKFEDVRTPDDKFLEDAIASGQLVRGDLRGRMVARLHGSNTQPYRLHELYKPVPLSALPEAFLEAVMPKGDDADRATASLSHARM